MDQDLLLQKIKANDSLAMSEFVHNELPRVYNLCLRLCQNKTTAEDLCQDVFVKAVKGIKNFNGEAAFSTWLYRITLNVWKNLVRHEKSRRQSQHFPLWSKKDEDGEVIGETELPEPDHTPDSWAQISDEHRRILTSMETLEKIDKSIIVLRDMEGKTYEEISDLLNLNIGTVKSRLSRARERLRDLCLASQGRIR